MLTSLAAVASGPEATVLDGPFVMAAALALAAGFVSFASPCVIPLVPGYLSYLVGLAGAESSELVPGRQRTGSAVTTKVRVQLRSRVVGAATLWDPPGRRKSSRLEELVMMPTMLWAFRSRVPASVQVMELMEKHHPTEPHWYLMLIGSDPSVRGAGFGQALMRSRLDRCDAERVPAYLENSNPNNESYYLRFGFEIMGEIRLPDDGPTMWPMWREPR